MILAFHVTFWLIDRQENKNIFFLQLFAGLFPSSSVISVSLLLFVVAHGGLAPAEWILCLHDFNTLKESCPTIGVKKTSF